MRDDHRARWTDVGEKLAVGSADLLPVGGRGQEGSRADDVLGAGTGFPKRLYDDLETAPRLAVRVGRRVGAVGHHRRRAGDVDRVADNDGAREPDHSLVWRSRGDPPPSLHRGLVSPPVDALRQVDDWPAEQAAVAVTGRVAATYGELDATFEWASVTKLAVAVAILVAVEEGIVDLDEDCGPPGSTLRHLLAHASGLPPERGAPISRPGQRRIYSNYGFEVAAELVSGRAEMPFSDYFASVWENGAVLRGSPASGVTGRLADLLDVAEELLRPAKLAGETLAEATSVQFPGLVGVLPGFGRMEPNDWGLGFELRDAKAPHWTGARNSPRTFGHFGQTGTFLWIDPEAELALACLTNLTFGDWATEAWPRLSDAVLELGSE